MGVSLGGGASDLAEIFRVLGQNFDPVTCWVNVEWHEHASLLPFLFLTRPIHHFPFLFSIGIRLLLESSQWGSTAANGISSGPLGGVG